MTAAKGAPTTPPKTLADLYEDRDLSAAQVRRLVALLGLAAPRPSQASRSDGEAA